MNTPLDSNGEAGCRADLRHSNVQVSPSAKRERSVRGGQGHPEVNPEHLGRMSALREALRAELAGVLPASGAIVLEVGCGHGHFLTAYAQAYPDRHCIGIDINLDRVLRGERKRKRAQLPNLHFVRAEAQLFLEVLPRDIRLAELFVLFPDPWPKKRHHKNRIMRKPFLDVVAGRCAPGVALRFRTDYAPYFEAVVETLRTDVHWETRVGEPWPFDVATIFQQKAERFDSLTAVRR